MINNPLFASAFAQARANKVDPIDYRPIDEVTGKPIIELSFSSINELNSCPHKYNLRKRYAQPDWSYEDELTSMAGTAIHEFAQKYAETKSLEEAHWALFSKWDFRVEQNATDKTKSERSFEACINTGLNLIQTRDYKNLEVAQVEQNGITSPAIEFGFCIYLRSNQWTNTYVYRGRVDLVAYNSAFDVFTVIDIKTHRNYQVANAPDNAYRYKYNDQLIPYGLVVQQLTNKPISLFRTEYHAIFLDLTSPVSEVYSFDRNQSDVDAWLFKIQLLIQSIESYSENTVWPKTYTGCEAWGKCCTFYGDICEADHELTIQELILRNQEPKPIKPFGEKAVVEINFDV